MSQRTNRVVVVEDEAGNAVEEFAVCGGNCGSRVQFEVGAAEELLRLRQPMISKASWDGIRVFPSEGLGPTRNHEHLAQFSQFKESTDRGVQVSTEGG